MRKNMLMKWGILTLLLIVLGSAACSNDDNNTESTRKKFGIFTVGSDGSSASVEGVIVDSTLDDFNKMIEQYPDLKTLNLVDVPDSDVSGDLKTDSALELGRKIYKLGISTHLVDDGVIKLVRTLNHLKSVLTNFFYGKECYL